MRFLLFRLGMIPMAGALIALFKAGVVDPGWGGVGTLYWVLGIYTALAIAPLAAPAALREQRPFLLLQVSIDFFLASVLIWITGGVESVFCPLLLATLFNATTVMRGRETMGLAGISTGFLAIASVTYRDALPLPFAGSPGNYGAPLTPGLAAAHLVAQGLALHAIALLGNRLSRGLGSMQSIQEEIIENMAEGLVAIDAAMRVIELNGEARRILGIGPDRACVGRPLSEVLVGDGAAPVRDAFASSERKRFEYVQPHADGTSFPVEAKISTIPDGEGMPRCRIGLFSDLSLKKDIEEAERRIHTLEEMYDVAMTIAHEIRNPLASIRGCVQELGRDRERTPCEKKLVDIVCRESDRLDGIIEDFMSNARRGPLSLRPVNLVKVIEDTVIQLRNHPQIGGRKIVFDSVNPVLISGDAKRLKQVFLNLGANALEATDPKTGAIRIALRAREFLALNRRRAGERQMVPGVEVEFADNGTGMSPEGKRMAFTPFYTTKENGHGLGLAIVHRIVHDHLGKVDLESEPERGTVFRVWFPILGQKIPQAQPAAEPAVEVAHA